MEYVFWDGKGDVIAILVSETDEFDGAAPGEVVIVDASTGDVRAVVRITGED